MAGRFRKLGSAFIDVFVDRSKLQASLKSAEQDVKTSTAKMDADAKKVGGSFEQVGKKIEDSTSGLRKFSGAISSTVGIATSLIGAFTGVVAVIGLIVAGAKLIVDWFTQANEKAKDFSRELEDAARTVDQLEASVTSLRFGDVGDELITEADLRAIERAQTSVRQLQDDLKELDETKLVDRQEARDIKRLVDERQREIHLLETRIRLRSQLREIREQEQEEEEKAQQKREAEQRQREFAATKEKAILAEIGELKAVGLDQDAARLQEELRHQKALEDVAEAYNTNAAAAARWERIEKRRHAAELNNIKEAADAKRQQEIKTEADKQAAILKAELERIEAVKKAQLAATREAIGGFNFAQITTSVEALKRQIEISNTRNLTP